jgi:hypothetical protein
MSFIALLFKNKPKLIKLVLALFLLAGTGNVFAVTYTMGTSGSQSATVTATSGSPDTFTDDNLGSGGKYSSNVDATYTFNCAGGKYVRFKINSIVTNSSADKFYVYDGATTSDRLMGETYFYGSDPGDFMYVSTTGSITVRFVTDGSGVSAGWNIDVWIANEPGQVWDGSSSTQPSTAANWEGSVVPYGGFTSIYIPSGLSNYPNFTSSSNTLTIYDLNIVSGASLTHSSDNNTIRIYGNITNNGTFNHPGSIYMYCEGGNSGNYATISGTGSTSYLGIIFGANRLAYYKLMDDLDIYIIQLLNDQGNSVFDMNNYNMNTLVTFIEASTTFYQRTGTLLMEYYEAGYINNTSFIENTGTTYFNSGYIYAVANQLIADLDYYNLKINTTNGYTSTVGEGSTLTVANDLTFTNTGAGGGVATLANDIDVGNNFYIGNTGNALTLNAPFRIYRTSGTGSLTMGNVTTHAINVTYASASDYVFAGFGATNTFYGTVTYNSASAQKVIPGTYYHLTTNSAGTKTLYGNMDINGNITLSGGSLAQGSYTMNIAGNWSSSGDYYAEGTGLVTFDGTGQNTITNSTSATETLLSEDFESAWTSCEKPNGWTSDVTCGGSDDAGYSIAWHRNDNEGDNWNFTSGDYSPTYASGSYSARFHTYGVHSTYNSYLQTPDVDLSAHTSCVLTFYYQNADGSDDLEVLFYDGSSWNSIATYTTNSWDLKTINIPSGYQISTFKVQFKATSDYGSTDIGIDLVKITGESAGGGPVETFNKFAINKTSGGDITLGSNIIVQTDLTFTAGIISTTTNYSVELHEDATMTGTPTNSCHINGYIKKNKNTAAKFTFPCGDGSYYRPLAITPAGTGATIWTCKYFTNGHADQTVLDIDHVSEVEYWTLDRAGASPENATIELSWNENSLVDEDYMDLVVAHYDGADWHDAGNNNIVGDSSAGTLESEVNWADYSPFTLGSIIGNVPLPITLVEFNASPHQNNIMTNWTTSAEINNDYFTVERSQNGVEFIPIGRVEGAGNSDYEINYFLIDKEFESGINYYRLKQTDYDGKETYSQIVSVDIEKDVKTLVNTVNALGQEVNENYKGIVFDIFSDGSSTKRFQ